MTASAAPPPEYHSAGRALIVAHGQPSDPAPAAAEIAALAERVARCLPGWQVRSATLAAENDLRAALAALRGGPLRVYPLFMADGWFTQVHLPARLVGAGADPAAVALLSPFGLDPAVQALTVDLARRAEADGATELLLAAHGSFRSPAPAAVARDVAALIAQQTGLARVGAAFIDQPPRIAEAAADYGPTAVCLPFFAARGGHVIDDLPEALDAARFRGRLLDPVGLDPRVPGLIASAIAAAA